LFKSDYVTTEKSRRSDLLIPVFSPCRRSASVPFVVQLISSSGFICREKFHTKREVRSCHFVRASFAPTCWCLSLCNLCIF